MIEVVSKSGKRLMNLSDNGTSEDTIIIDGRPVSLSDAYASEELKVKFNAQVKELRDDTDSNDTE